MINNILGGLFGKVVDNAEGILDKVITTDKERDEAKIELKKLFLDYESKIESEITNRWTSDNAQDSWLPRNIRPLVLAFLVVSTILLIFIDAGTIQFVVDSDWKDLLKMTLMTTVGAYFGGRSYEKVKK